MARSKTRWAMAAVGALLMSVPLMIIPSVVARAQQQSSKAMVGSLIVTGTRTVRHPVRPAPPWVSLAKQAGNADDVRMRALHGPGWRERAGVNDSLADAKELVRLLKDYDRRIALLRRRARRWASAPREGGRATA